MMKRILLFFAVGVAFAPAAVANSSNYLVTGDQGANVAYAASDCNTKYKQYRSSSSTVENGEGQSQAGGARDRK